MARRNPHVPSCSPWDFLWHAKFLCFYLSKAKNRKRENPTHRADHTSAARIPRTGGQGRFFTKPTSLVWRPGKRTSGRNNCTTDMFARLPTRYLQLMIREIHEPSNDNNDPYSPEFDDKNFEYCQQTPANRQSSSQFASLRFNSMPRFILRRRG